MILLVEVLYIFASLLLAVYGVNSLYMILRYLRVRHVKQETPVMNEWPRVTVQLPIYNEMHTVNRLLDAVSKLKYPRHLLEVQGECPQDPAPRIGRFPDRRMNPPRDR